MIDWVQALYDNMWCLTGWLFARAICTFAVVRADILWLKEYERDQKNRCVGHGNQSDPPRSPGP